MKKIMFKFLKLLIKHSNQKKSNLTIIEIYCSLCPISNDVFKISHPFVNNFNNQHYKQNNNYN